MDTNYSPKQNFGFVKSKLFYKAAKPACSSPPPVVPQGTANKSSPTSSMKRVNSFTKLAGIFGSGSGGSDGYVHGPDGGGGDSKVDVKAANYISSFKQRLILEELSVATNEKIEMFRSNY